MPDPLMLSLWLKDFSVMSMPLYFKKALEVFPFSKLSPVTALRVHAVSFREATLLEEHLDGPPNLTELVPVLQEHLNDDSAFVLEARWDLWQWDGEWHLKPSHATVECYGPGFESDRGEHVRIDAGPETLFLPQEKSDQLRPVQSNIRSLLHLASDLENALQVERRMLWSESDEDFAGRLRRMLD